MNSFDSAICSVDIIKHVKEKWLPYFHCLMAVFTDRGGEFMSRDFEEFITNEMWTVIIRTSSYYSQGCSINKAANRTINNTISLLETEVGDFNECMQLVATLHNTSSHAATDNTPFYLLFGFEATLPGWQEIQ